jgi:hypothetical protein
VLAVSHTTVYVRTVLTLHDKQDKPVPGYNGKIILMVVLQLRRLVSDLQQRSGLTLKAVLTLLVVDKAAKGLVFSELFGFLMSVSLHHYFIFIHVRSGGWTKGLLEAEIPQKLNRTPPQQ